MSLPVSSAIRPLLAIRYEWRVGLRATVRAWCPRPSDWSTGDPSPGLPRRCSVASDWRSTSWLSIPFSAKWPRLCRRRTLTSTERKWRHPQVAGSYSAWQAIWSMYMAKRSPLLCPYPAQQRHDLWRPSCLRSIQAWTYKPSFSRPALASSVSQNRVQDSNCLIECDLGSAPQYIADLLQLHTPSRSLRSSADSRMCQKSNTERGPERSCTINTQGS